MIWLVLFAIGLAFIWALWETQIEGENSWASALPCWRPTPQQEETWWVKFLRLFTYRRPLTGYHLGMVFTVGIAMHGAFLCGDTMPSYGEWDFWTSFRWECRLIGLFVITLVFEDFFYFVVNPHFKLADLLPGRGHKDWFIIPKDYLRGFAFAAILWGLAGLAQS